LRKDDFLARIELDEYALVLADLNDPKAIALVAKRLKASCEGIHVVDNLHLRVTARIGITRYPEDGDDPAVLVRLARIALQAIDTDPTQSFGFFSPMLLDRLRERVWLAADLEEALDQGRFLLHFQPLYALAGQTLVGVEALLRLRTPEGELVLPDRFIPLAESLGLMVPIGTWVLREACAQLGHWRRGGIRPLRMAINVSPQQLAHPGFPDALDLAVASGGIRYGDLELEITESLAMNDLPGVEQTMSEIGARGVKIALDDFGTGYSALAYLARLPLHTVKIDRSFLAGVPADAKASGVIAAIVAMARQLGLEVVAEGVETEAQYRFLARVGCHLGQGFGFCRPQTSERFLECLSSSRVWN
jgi:EAL domain-containing protein (putative c-di-GMP-specific phosphodiesterase class I)